MAMHNDAAGRTLPPALSAPSLLALWDLLPGARVVGGAVRDVLAERPIADIDLATPLPPAEVMAGLAAKGVRVIPTGLAHGTVTALVADQAFEVTTLRRDVVTDGRHAVVAFTDDWRADAARRDFTINAMSLGRDGTLFDYFGGRADLAAGRVCFVGEPAARLSEDFLRVLRFFRFFARYGRGEPDPGTLAALAVAAPGLARLSPERVWAELKRLLAAPRPAAAIGLMRDLGLLPHILPPPVTCDEFIRLLDRGAPDDPLLRLAALSAAEPADFVRRYRLSTAELERLAAMRGPCPDEQVDDLALRQWLIDVGRAALIDRTYLQGRSDRLRTRLQALPDLAFPVHGRDLLALGWTPGPELGRRLGELRDAWRASGGVLPADRLLAMVPPPGA